LGPKKTLKKVSNKEAFLPFREPGRVRLSPDMNTDLSSSKNEAHILAEHGSFIASYATKSTKPKACPISGLLSCELIDCT
jgi:hypothetical protein